MLKADFSSFYATVDGITIEHVDLPSAHNMSLRHFHDEYEIYYMLDGHRLFFIENNSFLASKGDLIIIESKMLHMTHVSPMHDPNYERIIFYITSKKMREIDRKNPSLHLEQLLHDYHGIYHTTEEQQRLFMHMYDTFKEEYNDAPIGFENVIEATFVSDFIRILRQLPINYEEHVNRIEGEKFQRVYEIAEYMTHNYATINCIDDIVDHFFISKYYLCRIFRTVTGHSIIDYLTSIKIQQATYFLETSDEPVTEVAQRVGYNSLTQFERVFKKLIGMSPAKYRKSIKDNGYVEGINKALPMR